MRPGKPADLSEDKANKVMQMTGIAQQQADYD